jgi:homoserine/homoserine lactone efflux protein
VDLKLWLLYLVTELLLIITPGPAVLLVSAQGLKYGARQSWFGALGVSGGNILYFILSAFGLGALILASGDLFEYLKAAGALYLIISGLVMLRNAGRDSKRAGSLKAAQGNFRSFLQGFVIQAANPKAIVFFIALLPQFITPERDLAIQLVILGITTVVLETSILSCYGWLASKGKRLAEQNRPFRKWQNIFTGTVLIGLGINLLLLESPSE